MINAFKNIPLRFKMSITAKISLAVLLIVICMLVDNGTALPYIFIEKEFSAYFGFFNTIVFTGMYGTYLASVLVCIPSVSMFCEDCKIKKSFGKQKARESTLKRFIRGTCYGGITLSASYLVFILLLIIFVPFVNQQDIASGLDYYPYVSLSANGGALVHIIAILFNGFLTGCIFSSMAILAASFTTNRFVVVMIPFTFKFLVVQVCRIFRVQSKFRPDYWLYMRRILDNYPLTLLLSLVAALVIVTSAAFIIIVCERRVKGNA